MKKLFFLFLFLIFLHVLSYAQKQTRALNTRSDTADITNTIIAVTNINKIAKTIEANATLSIKSKINNLQTIYLDLEGLQVDSIFVNNTAANYNYTSPLITIQLASTLNIGDSISTQIYYHGTPLSDPTWGGFYFSGVYAFNMGVGFTAQPHAVGRMLFPCFDNFVERCAFEFYITTANTDMAVCNGELEDSMFNANNEIIWHWKLQESIPSYLTSLAVAPYVFVKKNLNSISGTKELWIACLPADTNKVNGSFANIQQSYNMLEKYFGEYKWNKVGYSLVPFGAGAMEHATNIHIGVAFIDGTLNYETLIAHELSHHWFGDLATCSTAQDMWLNEGFASYCEMLHTEYVYGKDAYMKEYKANHVSMLNSAHINDDGYRAVSKMDSNHTYGTTVYNKGADMLHTLRTYLGDSLFFSGIKNYLNQNQFMHVSTIALQQSLSAYTGRNLTDFFSDWIMQAGFANFCIDSTQSTQVGADWKVKLFVRQRKHKNNNYYHNVLLPITIYKKDLSHITIPTNFNQQCQVYNFTFPFEPAFICIDEDEMISDASTANTMRINSIGFKIFADAKAKVKINAVVSSSDSTLIRIEQHYVAPDRFKTTFPSYVLHDTRYWQVNGINLGNIKGYLQFAYNVNIGNHYADSSWLQGNESNIRLFYRKDATEDWKFANDSLVTGGTTDKIGVIYAKEILPGEYALGINRIGYTDTIVTDAPVGLCSNIANEISDLQTEKPSSNFMIFPNPSNGEITIKSLQLNSRAITILIKNTDGKLIYTDTLQAYQLQKNISTNLAAGMYIVSFFIDNISIESANIIVKH